MGVGHFRRVRRRATTAGRLAVAEVAPSVAQPKPPEATVPTAVAEKPKGPPKSKRHG